MEEGTDVARNLLEFARVGWSSRWVIDWSVQVRPLWWLSRKPTHGMGGG